MGGKSTLQGAVFSSKQSDVSGVDLHSWQGLTEVLRRGKESLNDPVAYAEFRNLVLEYAQQGGDPELRKQIDATIAQFSKNTKQTKTDPAVTPTEKFGKSKKRKRKKKKRGAPASDSVPEANSAPASQTTPSTSTRRVPPAFKTPTPPPATQPRPAAEPPKELPIEPEEAPSVKEQKPREKNEQAISTEPVPASVPPPQNIQEPRVEAQEPQAPKFPAETETKVELKSTEEYKARIAEIKRLVHEQIGNPATLMDAYAGRGKEYMMALLSALKATGPGSPESPSGAMQRLERAYEALQEAPPEPEIQRTEESPVEEQGDEPSPPEPKPETPFPADSQDNRETQEKKEPEVQPQKSPPAVPPPPEPKPAETQEETPVPPPTPEPVTEEKQEQRKIEPQPQPKPVPEPPKTSEQVTQKREEEKKETPPPQPKPEQSESQTQPKPVPHPPKMHPPVQQKKDRQEEQVPKEERATEERKSKLSPASTLASLLMKDGDEGVNKEKERALHEIPPERVAASVHQEVQHAKENAPAVPKPSETGYKPIDGVDPAKVAVKQSELSSPEVTRALNQLLEEWSLFKGSGLFGIGPSGAEHPTYQKLAPLSMAEVVSGRWEGSDRKITANIKEYVNAWRHEQGVAYNIQETFEHYLRRVVLRIQKRHVE